MAYTIKQSIAAIEPLEIEDLNGNLLLHAAPKMDIDGLSERFNRARNQLIRAQQLIKKGAQNEEAYKEYANACINLIRVVFGDEDAAKIIEVYSDKPVEMMTDITPYIMEVFYPALRELSNNRRERVAKWQRYTQKRR